MGDECLTLAQAVCPPDDPRLARMRALVEQRPGAPELGYRNFSDVVSGIARGLYEDLSGGYLVDVASQIRADVEADLLGQAHQLIQDGLKDAAAMLTGAVLEDALRQLCRKNSVAEGKSIETMNEPLRAKGVYALPQKQQITAWAAIRNKADHAKFGEYSAEEVRLMHQGVLAFIAQHLS